MYTISNIVKCEGKNKREGEKRGKEKYSLSSRMVPFFNKLDSKKTTITTKRFIS